MNGYDVIVVGSGIGGLECAAMLSKEGYKVCLVEKNATLGGCFQSFKRNGHIIDTGIHYIGGLDDGEVLNSYFKYLGVLDMISLKRLDEDAFDVIHYKNKAYHLAMGFERFKDSLAESFPHEREGLKRYVAGIEDIYGGVSVDNLKRGIITASGVEYFSHSAAGFINDCVADTTLRNVLAGNSMLYAGDYHHSTLYHHAMVTGSNLRGAYRIVNGSHTVVDALVTTIKDNGGDILSNCEVNRFVVENDVVAAVEINRGERIEAKAFISDLHPTVTFNMLDRSSLIRKSFYTRINSLPNTYGAFSAYLIMKKDCYEYQNSNYYIHNGDSTWYDKNSKGNFAMMCSQVGSAVSEYSDVISILCPMEFAEVAEWTDTRVGKRGESYETFKGKKAEELIDLCAKFFPELKSSIDKIYTSTPLTYRDYTATPEGSAYGLAKSYTNSLVSVIPSRTRIGNLYLTGQNLNVHGVFGVSLTSMLTCAEFLGEEYLAKKIGNL